LVIVILLLGAGAAWGGWIYWRNLPFETTDDAFVEGHVVEISPQIAAPVLAVNFKDNQSVTQGDLLVELDPREFEAQLAAARAQLASAKAGLAQAEAEKSVDEAGAGQAEAELDSARAGADRAEADLRRNQSLDTKKVISARELDAAVEIAQATRASAGAAEKKLLAVRAQRAVADAQAASARAAIESANAQIRQAELRLSYARIAAPVSGRIARKSVEPGAYAQPGQTIFSIVPPNLWVVANFKETQLRHIRPGQPVDLSVDSLDGPPLKGHVDSVQTGTGSRFSALPPENATGNYVKIVQRVPVKITFDEPAEKIGQLALGLSVTPRVRVR
jgi:membrane fusion protein (multidrug efflux system)